MSPKTFSKFDQNPAKILNLAGYGTNWIQS